MPKKEEEQSQNQQQDVADVASKLGNLPVIYLQSLEKSEFTGEAVTSVIVVMEKGVVKSFDYETKTLVHG